METKRLLVLMMETIEYCEEHGVNPQDIISLTQEEYNEITSLFDVKFE